MALKLNLGCGEQLLPGYLNCDVLPHIQADRHFDLNVFPYPFEGDSVEEVFMDNVLEHLDDVPGVMSELYRILHDGGVVRIIVPYAKTDWAFQDPTHKHFFTEQSMQYFTGEGRYGYYTAGKFRVKKADLVSHSTTWLHRLRNLIPFRNILRYVFFNMYDNVYFELEKVRPSANGVPERDKGSDSPVV